MTLDQISPPPKLTPSDALGRRIDDRTVSLEFQVGTSLVWFRFSASLDEREAIVEGNQLLALACAHASHAMELAAQQSRRVAPEFWAEHDNTTAKGSRLAIWGARLDVSMGTIEYDISQNHEFFDSNSRTYSVLDVYEEHPMQLPAFPDEHHVYLVRTEDGSWFSHSIPRI